MNKILVTGGTGYIGSHVIVELLNGGFDDITIVDNLSNSKEEVLNRIEKITGKKPTFHKVDLLDEKALEKVFTEGKFDVVMHFAGLKAVGESVQKPLEYYENNITGTLNLLKIMQKHGVKGLIFSSSATVYGTPENLPLTEQSRVGVGISNPYGWTKYMLEQIIKDLYVADNSLKITILRYFNPIGAHTSGLIGEDPNGIPNNLVPFVSQFATGKHAKLMVYGDDYPTPDGTGVRDYIHVVDLAKGHVAALKNITTGVNIYNLGTGNGSSVLEVIETFGKVVGKKLPYTVTPRRAGDIAACYTSGEKALNELGWQAEKSLKDALRDAWNWQTKSPDGYGDDN